MTVCTYSEKLEVNSACSLNCFGIALALCIAILSIAVKEVYILLFDINMIEKILVHEGVVAVLVMLVQVTIFIKIECCNVLEADFAVIVKLNKLLICRYGSCARCESENCIRLVSYKILVKLSCRTSNLLCVVENFNIHCFAFLLL